MALWGFSNLKIKIHHFEFSDYCLKICSNIHDNTN